MGPLGTPCTPMYIHASDSRAIAALPCTRHVRRARCTPCTLCHVHAMYSARGASHVHFAMYISPMCTYARHVQVYEKEVPRPCCN